MSARFAGALDYLLSRILRAGVRVISAERYDQLSALENREAASSARPNSLLAASRLQQYAEQQGEDFNALTARAASRFSSDVIQRRGQPLSAAELEQFFDDDQSASGR
jgi:hypothetical protein